MVPSSDVAQVFSTETLVRAHQLHGEEWGMRAPVPDDHSDYSASSSELFSSDDEAIRRGTWLRRRVGYCRVLSCAVVCFVCCRVLSCAVVY
jgi:hypothetical protein